MLSLLSDRVRIHHDAQVRMFFQQGFTGSWGNRMDQSQVLKARSAWEVRLLPPPPPPWKRSYVSKNINVSCGKWGTCWITGCNSARRYGAGLKASCCYGSIQAQKQYNKKSMIFRCQCSQGSLRQIPVLLAYANLLAYICMNSWLVNGDSNIPR